MKPLEPVKPINQGNSLPAPHCHIEQLSQAVFCSHCHFVFSQSPPHAVTETWFAKWHSSQIHEHNTRRHYAQ